MDTKTNQDKVCSLCGEKLETSEQRPFAAGIFYKCQTCKKEFKKTNYLDMQTGKGFYQITPIKKETGGQNVQSKIKKFGK